jgi:hypothetical protein
MFFLNVVTFSRNSCILRFKWSHTYQIMLLTEMFLPSYKILNILKINSLFKEALATILTKQIICFENW